MNDHSVSKRSTEGGDLVGVGNKRDRARELLQFSLAAPIILSVILFRRIVSFIASLGSSRETWQAGIGGAMDRQADEGTDIFRSAFDRVFWRRNRTLEAGLGVTAGDTDRQTALPRSDKD